MTKIFSKGGMIAVTNDGPKGPARIAKSGSIGLAIKNKVEIISNSKNDNETLYPPPNTFVNDGYLIVRPECIEFKKPEGEKTHQSCSKSFARKCVKRHWCR